MKFNSPDDRDDGELLVWTRYLKYLRHKTIFSTGWCRLTEYSNTRANDHSYKSTQYFLINMKMTIMMMMTTIMMMTMMMMNNRLFLLQHVIWMFIFAWTGVGHFCVNPRFNPRQVRWNLGLTRRFPTLAWMTHLTGLYITFACVHFTLYTTGFLLKVKWTQWQTFDFPAYSINPTWKKTLNSQHSLLFLK